MSLANFVPEAWSGELLFNYVPNTVFEGLTNRNYEGEVTAFGDTVKITSPGPISVNAYTGTVTYETPQSTLQSMVIDQDYAWAFALDDLARVQAKPELMQPFMRKAGEALAQKVDENIAALYTEAGLADVDVTLSSGDMYTTMVTAGQRLDEANVPSAGRWAVISPAGYAKLLQTTEFVHATAAGDSVARTGMVGQVAGFTIYKSNNLVLSTTRRYMYGTNDAITFALQHQMAEPVRLEGSFKDGVRGRHVWGRKVVYPEALGVIKATE